MSSPSSSGPPCNSNICSDPGNLCLARPSASFRALRGGWTAVNSPFNSFTVTIPDRSP